MTKVHKVDFDDLSKHKTTATLASGRNHDGGTKVLEAIVEYETDSVYYLIRSGKEEENALSLDRAIIIYNSY